VADTIDFLLSPKRDASAAKRFLQKALRSPNHPRPRVINVDGNPAYSTAIDELKRTRELGRRCRVDRFAISIMWWSKIIVRSNGGSMLAWVFVPSMTPKERFKVTKQ
jgi:transposase-like protein